MSGHAAPGNALTREDSYYQNVKFVGCKRVPSLSEICPSMFTLRFSFVLGFIFCASTANLDGQISLNDRSFAFWAMPV